MRRILVTQGELVRSFPMEKWCKQMVHVRVPDAARFFRRVHEDYGAHFTLVLGDYVKKLQGVAGMLGMEVELI
ncbi:MAG: hypothetical protein J7M34_15055 [Anaerolineae bacterium]|nr:hypothetical protein [Anaerolineae bacterium]